MTDRRDERTEFQRRIETVLRRVRPGEVATYGEIAAEAGRPGAARAVGRVLATCEGLPWWRVVASTGRLVPGHEQEHARLLRAEGVTVADGRVRLTPRRHPGGPDAMSERRARRDRSVSSRGV